MALALALGFTATLRFAKWLVPFICQRLDVRNVRLEAKERAADSRMNKRILHLEMELDCFREATMKLLNVVAEIAPGHRALADVARMIRKTPPIAGVELDELTARLNGIPATGGMQ